MKKPTLEECQSHAVVEGGGVACRYPQMGGYGSACVVVAGVDDGPEGLDGFDAYVWHDGDFPFADDDERPPRVLHHCSAGQFVEFGQFVQTLIDAKNGGSQ